MFQFLLLFTTEWECDGSDGQYRDLASAKTLRVPLMKVIKRGTQQINARNAAHIWWHWQSSYQWNFWAISNIHSSNLCSKYCLKWTFQKGGMWLWGAQYSHPPGGRDPGVGCYFMHYFARTLTALLYTGFCCREVYVHFCQRTEKGWREGSTWGAARAPAPQCVGGIFYTETSALQRCH